MWAWEATTSPPLPCVPYLYPADGVLLQPDTPPQCATLLMPPEPHGLQESMCKINTLCRNKVVHKRITFFDREYSFYI